MKKEKLNSIQLIKATRECMCSHCFWLWQTAYDPKGDLSWFNMRALVDGIIKRGKRRPK